MSTTPPHQPADASNPNEVGARVVSEASHRSGSVEIGTPIPPFQQQANDFHDEDDLTVEEIRQWVEFGAWCGFVMAPIIWWLQGPSVSTDQFYVRSGLVVISFLTGAGLRIWALMEKRSPPLENGKVSNR